MINSIKASVILVIISCVFEVKAWDNDELEIFDLVEEINENFYGLLGVSKDAKLPEIKRAYRNLSIVLHPDKNSAADANEKFRNLVSVYDVLKDTSKREKYDDVLKNGLPNWRSAVYYYRHYRKMGIVEMSIILFIIVTVCQYIVSWAAYLEKKYTAEQILGSKLKKMSKKNKSAPGLASILDEIPAPSVRNTLPFQIPRLLWNIITGIPGAIVAFKDHLQEQKRQKQEALQWEIDEQKRLEEELIEAEKAKEARGARRRKPGFTLPELTDEDYVQSSPVQKNNTIMHKPAPVVSGGLWVDEDLAELIRLVKKYPGGTPERWERISSAMNRPVAEVTHMAAKMKDNCYRVPGQPEENEETEVVEPVKKVKTKGGKLGEGTPSFWSQDQQKALESALAKFPKGGAQDRWEKIAHCVPGKTKEECMLRYKLLVETVKKQHQKNPEAPESKDSGEDNDNASVKQVEVSPTVIQPPC